VKDSRADSKARLLCLEEKIQQADPRNPKRASHALSSSSPVISLHALPSYNVTEEEPESHDVLVLHEDGTADCLSSTLAHSVWTIQLSTVTQSADGLVSPENYHIIHAELIELGAARKGLLKGRDDVLALLESEGESNIDSANSAQLLFVITEHFSIVDRDNPSSSRDVHIYALRPRTSSSGPSSRSLPQHLLTFPLPQKEVNDSPKSIFSLYAASGALEELSGGLITIYDFSGISPRVLSVLKNPDGMDTFVRLSSSLLLTASSQQYNVYDVKYNSIQASLPIAPPASSIAKSKKRKSSDVEASTGTSEFIGYFSKAGVAVALSGRQLLAVQISQENDSSKRRKIGDTLLIDSIGRGTELVVTSQSVRASSASKAHWPSSLSKTSIGFARLHDNVDWPKQAEELDKLLAEDKLPEFEVQFATLLGLKTNWAKFVKDKKRRDEGRGKVPLEWRYPEVNARKTLQVHREKALYALGRIFVVQQPVDSASPLNSYDSRPSIIAVKLDAPNVLYWLAVTGQLTAPLVQQALQQTSKTEHEVSHGDVIAAIAEFDPSLSRLHMIMDSPARLDLEEIAQALKAIVQSLDDSTLPKPDPRLVADLEDDKGLIVPEVLTNGTLRFINGDTELTNGHAEETYSDAATDAAMEDLDDEINYAIDTLESGLPIRGESLRQALSKLNSFPSKDIVQTLRRNLSQHQIVFLIHILRIELADGGWTSRYIDVGPDASPNDTGEPSDRAISVIAKILSCAVDAMGMSGWLSASASDPVDSVDELLLSLRAEISATLEGVHEATFLSGVLSEFLRYPYKRAKAGWYRKPNEGASRALREGRVWRVEKAEEPSLPMGLKVETKVADTYVRDGGMIVELSKKEKGQALNRTVGKYSFEKIRI
jgi:hypothetical protein